LKSSFIILIKPLKLLPKNNTNPLSSKSHFATISRIFSEVVISSH